MTENNWPQMQLSPVGEVKSELKNPTLKADESGLTLEKRMDRLREEQNRIKSLVCEIHILKKYEALLDGLEGFSHILVLYWPHLIDPTRRNLEKVHPMGRKDIPMQGIYATCSPVRPNPVLVSAVKLLGRKNNILKVQGLEAVNGSPIVDIKPYNKNYYGVSDATVPEWMEKIQKELETKQ